MKRRSVRHVLVAAALVTIGAPTSALAAADSAATPADVLARSFRSVLADMQDTSAPHLQVAARDGSVGRTAPGRVVWASEPLQVDGAPVQRALAVDGSVAEPVNPLVGAALPLDPSRPMTVGDGSSLFTVAPTDAADGAHQVVGDGVLHANTYAATDTIARAVSGGAETYELIRGPQAPTRFTYRVAGATPRDAGDGTIEIVRDGRVIGQVTAPTVVDSAGAAVSAHLSADGDDVVFTVEHLAAGTSYPVLADPTWTADYNFSLADQGRGGLFFENNGGGYDIAAVPGGAHPGITIQPLGGRTYTSADSGRAFFAAPPGSTIDKVDFQNVYRYNRLERQTMRLGLYGPGIDIQDDYSDNIVSTQGSVLLDDPADAAKFAMVWLFTPACGTGESNCPRFVPTGSPTRVTVGRMVVTLVDPGAPSISMSGGVTALGDGWIKGEGTHDLTVNFNDDGTGVRSWKVAQVRGGSSVDIAGPEVNACDDRHTDPDAQAFPCPQSDQFTDSAVDLGGLLEGTIQLVPSATDYAGNSNDGSGQALQLRLDRSPPSVDAIGGNLIGGTAGRWQQLRGTQPFTVDLSDRYSGVKKADVTLTPIAPAGTPASWEVDACGAGGTVAQPCPTSNRKQLDVDGGALPDGELEVSAKATDYVGYGSDPVTARIFKDNTSPAATAKGELTDLEDEWTSSTSDTPVTLQGKDRRSGVARLELYAQDDNGRRLVDDIAVCDPQQVDAAAGETCPQQVSRQTNVDLGGLETGQVTLEAYATDAAGNRDPSPDSWDTYVDHDAPSEVSHMSAALGADDTTRISWTPASDEGSGVQGYEYRLSIDDRTTEWVTTPFPGATIPTELQRAIVEVRAKDRSGNRGHAARLALPLDSVGVLLETCSKVAGSLKGETVKKVCGTLEQYRKSLNDQAIAAAGGFICGEVGFPCSLWPGRNTVGWLTGELAADFTDWGQARDFVVSIIRGKEAEAALAAAGFIPIVGTGEKMGGTILKFAKRVRMPLSKVLRLVRKVFGTSDFAASLTREYFRLKGRALKDTFDDLAAHVGADDGLTRKVLDKFTNGAYSTFRNNGLSHEGVSQLVKSGNKLENIIANATLRKMDLSGHDYDVITDRIAQHWKTKSGAAASGNALTEARGVESALRYLEYQPNVRVLLDGRPNSSLSRAGPDIVAVNTDTGRLIVVEAKGTASATSPMGLSKLKAKVGGRSYVQPSPQWLRAQRKGSSDYLTKLKVSSNSAHQHAAKLLEELARKDRGVDLVVVQTRPKAGGSKAYGAGVDAATRVLMHDESDGVVKAIDMVDVPF